MKIRELIAALVLISAPQAASATPVRTPHVEAELVARHESFVPGKPLEAALRLKIKDHWHTYWRNPGDSGLPTKLEWRLPEGFGAGPIEWPYPKRLPLGPLMNFGYEGEVLHLVEIETPASWPAGKRATLQAKAEWLVCSDVCIPESADLLLSIPASASEPKVSNLGGLFSSAIEALPMKGPPATFQKSGGQILMSVSANPAGSGVHFFPYAEGLIANAAAQSVNRGADALSLAVPIADLPGEIPAKIAGVLVSEDGWPQYGGKRAIEIQAAPGAAGSFITPVKPNAADLGLAMALVLGVAGGLLLNLMPCVFPVLGIKVLQFANHAHGDARALRMQGWSYVAGVVVSFWGLSLLLLTLKAAGHAIGWGFQLQSPEFVTLLCALFLLLSLNLLGCFEWGAGVQRLAGGRETAAGGTRAAFLAGVLATLVATPCTAPFMGAALGFTLSQSASIAMLVFTAIGVGMALPILLLCLRPRWVGKLPRPGKWMETVKQLFAFPLLATVVWLLWVLGSQTGNDGVARALAGLVVIALAAWTYGRWQLTKPMASTMAGVLIGALGLALAWPTNAAMTGYAANSKQVESDGWHPYSEQEVQRLRAQGTPVFVDFTASWCITCQVNKRSTLNSQEVQDQFRERKVHLMRADWSRQDPEITRALASFGRNGVPLYVFYPRGKDAKVLPEILTPGIVLEALSAP